jgi:hypothetical protein
MDGTAPIGKLSQVFESAKDPEDQRKLQWRRSAQTRYYDSEEFFSQAHDPPVLVPNSARTTLQKTEHSCRLADGAGIVSCLSRSSGGSRVWVRGQWTKQRSTMPQKRKVGSARHVIDPLLSVEYLPVESIVGPSKVIPCDQYNA